MPEQLYSSYQVANLLGVTPGAVAQWIRNGDLQFDHQPDGQIRIGRDHLAAFCRNRGLDVPAVVAGSVAPAAADSRAALSGGPGVAAGPPEQLLEAGGRPRLADRQAIQTPRGSEADSAAAPGPAPADEPPYAQPGTATAAQVARAVLHDAVRRQASCIHLQHGADGLSLKLRVDGVLRDKANFNRLLPPGLQEPLYAHFVSLAGLDSAAMERPQTGSFTMEADGRCVRFDLATCPTLSGLKLAIRVLDPKVVAPALADVGLADVDLARVRRILDRASGLIVVAGPGDVTHPTLRAMLGELDRRGRDVMSVGRGAVGDLAGVTHVRVDPDAGFGFAAAAAAAVASDADVIMISELRDLSTARAALDAALAGRLVLLGAPAGDPARVVERLIETPASTWALWPALRAVICQQRLRRLCEHCKRPAEPAQELLDALAITVEGLTGAVFGPVGCGRCSGSGYAGYVNVFATMFPASQARSASAGMGAPGDGAAAIKQAAIRKVNEGATSLEELVRVVSP